MLFLYVGLLSCDWFIIPQFSWFHQNKMFSLGHERALSRFSPWSMLISYSVVSLLSLRLSHIRWSISTVTSYSLHDTIDGLLSVLWIVIQNCKLSSGSLQLAALPNCHSSVDAITFNTLLPQKSDIWGILSAEQLLCQLQKTVETNRRRLGKVHETLWSNMKSMSKQGRKISLLASAFRPAVGLNQSSIQCV